MRILNFDCEDYYGENIFSRDDFAKLCGQLAGIKGRFLLSINDMPEIRETFGRFNMLEAPTKYSVGGGEKQKAATEFCLRTIR